MNWLFCVLITERNQKNNLIWPWSDHSVCVCLIGAISSLLTLKLCDILYVNWIDTHWRPFSPNWKQNGCSIHSFIRSVLSRIRNKTDYFNFDIIWLNPRVLPKHGCVVKTRATEQRTCASIFHRNLLKYPLRWWYPMLAWLHLYLLV